MCENTGLTIQAKQAITRLSYVGFSHPENLILAAESDLHR